ncbi:hypothetical protein BX265_6165 [Streptomyces sp. TLI_235]|nr:hypothetical protein [Streptomyces sp. TLI_235]PBC71555.1 hypothetical protein BX265_6165 [Streptomyces sp. TLI_235]
MSDLAQRLADTATGTWGEEASTWLLDIHDHWIPELDRCGLIRQQPTASGDTATTINWAINTNQTPLIGTQSEWQILRVAADLAGKPIDDWFTQDLTSLDHENKRLALHATAWASGGRAFADSLGLLATQLWVADYEGAEITVWSTAEKARAYCDDIAKVDRATGQGWDWVPVEDGAEQMIWVRDLDDAPVTAGPGRITPVTIDPAN